MNCLPMWQTLPAQDSRHKTLGINPKLSDTDAQVKGSVHDHVT